MNKTMILGVSLLLGACASEPLRTVPANQTVHDYITTSQLVEVQEIRKTDRDSWQYVNDRYAIYRGRPDMFLMQFKRNCEGLNEKGTLPPADLIHDHRNLRPTDTFRGCIVQKIYSISEEQRVELRNLGKTPGESNMT